MLYYAVLCQVSPIFQFTLVLCLLSSIFGLWFWVSAWPTSTFPPNHPNHTLCSLRKIMNYYIETHSNALSTSTSASASASALYFWPVATPLFLVVARKAHSITIFVINRFKRTRNIHPFVCPSNVSFSLQIEAKRIYSLSMSLQVL